MSRATKAVFVIMFVLAISAGVAVGMLAATRGTPPAPPQPQQVPAHHVQGPARGAIDTTKPSPWLVEQLQLSQEQQSKMEQIWADLIKSKGHAYGDELRAIHQQREAEIGSLLSDVQRQQYEQINAKYAQKAQELWKRFEQDFEQAAARTRQILSDSQRTKFDAMIEKFRSMQQNGPRWAGGGRMGSLPPPTTSPSRN
jgi:hypothetical protein